MAWNTVAETQSGRRVLGQAAQITGANLYQRKADKPEQSASDSEEPCSF